MGLGTLTGLLGILIGLGLLIMVGFQGLERAFARSDRRGCRGFLLP
jgi:hypothetical protein